MVDGFYEVAHAFNKEKPVRVAIAAIALQPLYRRQCRRDV